MNDRVFVRLEEAAMQALNDYMAYAAYQGENPDYYKRARIGIPVLSTYGRVRGTRANERQLDIIERRFASGDMGADTRLAIAGSQDHALPSAEDKATEPAARGARRERR